SQDLGRGDDELGGGLAIKFLTELAAAATQPEKVLFLNSGVWLLTEKSAALPHLKKLEEAGVELRACGTCLEWFQLADSIVVGRQTNMAAILADLAAAKKVVTL
ncbi:MAG: sulfurtransferase-like selenium metabolism protein YedF, partial [bacterium]